MTNILNRIFEMFQKNFVAMLVFMNAQNTYRRIFTAMIAALVLTPTAIHATSNTSKEEQIQNALTSIGVEDLFASTLTDLVSLWPDDATIRNYSSEEVVERFRIASDYWDLISPEWRDVPETLMKQVLLCRTQIIAGTTDTDIDECGDQLRHQLRFRHAEAVTTQLQSRIDQVNQLEEPARTSSLQILEMLRERARTRLQEMNMLSDDEVDDQLRPIGENREELNRIRERLEEQVQNMTQTTDGTQSNQSNNQQQGVTR